MILILCEKPSQARNYSLAMSGSKSNVDKKIKYQGKDFIIVNARGHLYQWADMAGVVYKKWCLDELPWELDKFTWKRTVASDCRDVIRNIKEKAKDCSEIWIATDNDLSGDVCFR